MGSRTESSLPQGDLAVFRDLVRKCIGGRVSDSGVFLIQVFLSYRKGKPRRLAETEVGLL